MAGSVNKCILVGNLGADPEVRRMNDGSPVVSLRIATSESWRDKNSGERKEKTEWHQVVIFNDNLAKVAESYLRKGMKVFVEGSLQTRKWSKDGVERYTTEIVLQKFRGELQMLDAKTEGQDEKPGMSAYASRADRDADQGMYGREPDDGDARGGSAAALDDDIPFAPEWR